MAKKAILRVKNSSDYVSTPIPIPGGEKKDFFNGDDKAFAEHKASLISAVSLISQEIGTRDCQSFATLKVTLKEEALAKSHRPTAALFNHKHPVVGGGDMGEVYVQTNSRSLPALSERITQAKTQSEVKFDKNGKVVPKVGVLRSEVSAIKSIGLLGGDDKSPLSDNEIFTEIFNSKRDLIIELFHPVISSSISSEEIRSLKNAFINDLCQTFKSFSYIPESNYFSDGLVTLSPLYFDGDEVANLLVKLRASPLVRKFYPTPIISFSEVKADYSKKIYDFPKRDADRSYPKVILLDKGVRGELLKPWVRERADSLGDSTLSEYHADEMASLLVGSKFLNEKTYLEEDGCDIYDIWLPSNVDSFDEQFSSLSEFMDWLYLEIQSARDLGYRIVSMSINFQSVASDNEYSFLASRIDEISRKLDVLFIISTGNLEGKHYRPEWPKLDSDVFKMLARHRYDDKLLLPADSVSSITVGAINHVENELLTDGAPTRYTLRGPSTAYGIKPDLVHVGGIGDSTNSYFLTIDGLNQIHSTSQGTSIATPHVAKTFAVLDDVTDNQLSLNALKAMVLHSCSVPPCMSSKELKKEAREYLGFGFPCRSSDIISKDESSFSLLFESNLKRGQVAEFQFNWPKSLTTSDGKCKGSVKMTLVYEPPIDRDYGQEYIRANVNASLQQEKVKGEERSFKKAVDSIWDTKLGEDSGYEKNLISHGFKWWPSKVYARQSSRGFGNTTNWRLSVKSQVRDGVSYPEAGINFAVIITIEDPTNKSQDVYNEVRYSLGQIGVDVEDVTIEQQVKVQ
jgi:hypothetical protein